MRIRVRLRGIRPTRASRAAAWAASAVAALALLAIMITPAGPGATTLVSRMASVARTITRLSPKVPPFLAHERQFSGTPATGALFTYANGKLGAHFCSASVVDSSTKDLVITAAHCVWALPPQQIAFVPGYRTGQAPYGIWTVRRILVDRAWKRRQDPNHDVAFLVVQQAGSAMAIQDATGGERLGIGWRQQVWAHVIGYPNQSERPVICEARTRVPRLPRSQARYEDTQMEFDCAGYTNGTSGGPFLARYNYRTGEGVVVGVIGGYETGGDIASVSYSPRFGRAVESLYRVAVHAG